MKLTLVLLVAILFTSQGFSVSAQTLARSASAVKTLRNNDVLRMVQAQVTPEAIIDSIKSSPCLFDIFPPVLRDLHARGVPASVIEAMIKAPSGPSASSLRGDMPAPPEVVAMTLSAGTPVEVMAASDVNSARAKEGAALLFRVVRPVRVNGVAVIAPGALATAHVVGVKKGNSWGRGGELTWSMQDVAAVDGSRIPLRFERAAKGGSKGGVVATGMGATAAAAVWLPPLAPAAFFWGLVKGREASVSAGERYTVSVGGDARVSAARPQPRLVTYNDAKWLGELNARPPATLIRLSRESIFRPF